MTALFNKAPKIKDPKRSDAEIRQEALQARMRIRRRAGRSSTIGQGSMGTNTRGVALSGQ